MSDSGSVRELADFRIDEERPSRDVLVLVVRGEADLHAARELHDRLAAGDDHLSWVVDLTDCSFVDSSTLSVLVQEMRRLRGKGNDLRVVVPPLAPIRRIFELTMLDRVIALDDTRSGAVAASETRTSG